MIPQDIEKEIAQIDELYQAIKVGRTESEAMHIHRMLAEKFRHNHMADVLKRGMEQIVEVQRRQSTFSYPQRIDY